MTTAEVSMCEEPTDREDDGEEADGFHDLPAIVKLFYVVGSWVLLPVELAKDALRRLRSR